MTNNGVTASALTGRGAHFAICGMATNRIAGVIASAVKATQPEIYKELAANLSRTATSWQPAWWQ